MKFSSIVILTDLHLPAFAQTPMRLVDELVNRTDPGRPVVMQ